MQFPAAAACMSNSTTNSLSEEANSVSSSGPRFHLVQADDHFSGLLINPLLSTSTTFNVSHDDPDQQLPQKVKKKRNLPGNPDPDAEVIALSPKTLLATNRFVCEICNKGFQRDQNLQLHRRGHNLPWKLKQRNNKEMIRKKAYVCPEPSCVHHHPSRALGDLTGIKKHFCRKHGEKKWKCEKCSKIYAVQSDWKAHSKTCGTREYKCDCGTLFSRKDSFITHRAFCNALAEESARVSANQLAAISINNTNTYNYHNTNITPRPQSLFPFPITQLQQHSTSWPDHHHLPAFLNPNPNIAMNPLLGNPNHNNHNPFHHLIKSEVLLEPAHDDDHHGHNFHHQTNIPISSPNKSSSPLFININGSHMLTSCGSTAQQQQQQEAASANCHMSATALLQKAASVGPSAVSNSSCPDRHLHGQYYYSTGHDHMMTATHHRDLNVDTVNQVPLLVPDDHDIAAWQKSDRSLTRDFLGLTHEDHHHHRQGAVARAGSGSTTTGSCYGNGNAGHGYDHHAVNVMSVKDTLTYTRGVGFDDHHGRDDDDDDAGFGFSEPAAPDQTWGDF